MPPQVKGRVLHILCKTNIGDWNLQNIPFTNWDVIPVFEFDDDKNKEAAVIKILNTIASKKEFQEIQEKMSEKPLSPDLAEREEQKRNNLTRAKSDLSWLLDGEMKNHYNRWYSKLPDEATKIT
jgi:hypothetical protein